MRNKIMQNYYSQKLNTERLIKVYDIAPPRVQQYLKAELDFVLNKISSEDIVLDLGCGYGRIISPLAQKAKYVHGIDISEQNIQLVQKLYRQLANVSFKVMNAINLQFTDESHDVVVCIQNGISAFHVDPKALIQESVRVTKPGGRILFSTYTEDFWPYRLEWFEIQAKAGLLGEIDYRKTKDGVIVCKDGFTATTFTPQKFTTLTSQLGLATQIVKVDDSSLFCEIRI